MTPMMKVKVVDSGAMATVRLVDSNPMMTGLVVTDRADMTVQVVTGAAMMTAALFNADGSAYGAVVDPYVTKRNAAIAAAQRNNAALWFAGNAADLTGNVFSDSAGTVQAAAGDPIGYLKDRNGNLYPATQATSANKPTLSLGAGGYYGAQFNGTSRYLMHSLATTVAGDSTLVGAFAVSNFAGSGMAIVDGGVISLAPMLWVNASGFPEAYYRGTATFQIPGASSATGGASFASMRKIGNVETLYSPGGASVSQTHAITETTGAVMGNIGAFQNGGGGFFNGQIFLACACNTAMPDADRQAIEAFGALLAGAAYP